MPGITDHPDDFESGPTAELMAPKRSWQRFGLICPKKSGAKRTCSLPVS
jgi:hypothetical protein